MRWIFFAVILVPVLSLWAMPGQAQQGSMTQRERLTVQSPILTIDSDRIFNESAFGLRVARDVEVQSAGLAAENRKIEAELEAEEKRLTEQRSTLDAGAAVILERLSVFVSANAIDITDEAIKRLDATLGSGKN